MGLWSHIQKEYRKAHSQSPPKQSTPNYSSTPSQEQPPNNQGSPYAQGPPYGQPAPSFPTPNYNYNYAYSPAPTPDLSAQMGAMNLGGGPPGPPPRRNSDGNKLTKPPPEVPTVLTPGNRYDMHVGAQYNGNVDYMSPQPLRNPVPRPPQQIDLPMPQYYGQPYDPYAQTGALQPPVPPNFQHANSAPSSVPPSAVWNVGAPPSGPSTPTALQPPDGRGRASSAPPTPSTTTGGVTQCAGVTKSNKRCTRPVKVPPALGFLNPDEEIPRYCFQHAKEMMAVTGFYSHSTKDWINFVDWIPEYLDEGTKVILRSEMEKPISDSDVEGYIYCYELRDTTNPDVVHLKVGRAVNLVKRIDEWTKSCESKEPVLRGWYPGPDDGNGGKGVSMMKGKVRAGQKGKNCHRLERLIHLELADLVVNKPYLRDDFDNGAAPSTKSSGSSSNAQDKKKTKTKAKPKPKTKARGKLKKKSSDDDEDEDEEDGDEEDGDEDEDEEDESSSSAPTASSSSKSKKPKTRATKMAAREPCKDCGQVHKEIFTFVRPTSGVYKAKEWESIAQPVIEKWGGFVDSFT